MADMPRRERKSMEQQLTELQEENHALKRKLGLPISESSGSRPKQKIVELTEANPRPLINAYSSLGLSEREARIAASVEATLIGDENLKTNLKAAFGLLGLSEAEAELAARGR